jgi:hypothetical protein
VLHNLIPSAVLFNAPPERRIGSVNAKSSEAICASVRIFEYVVIEFGDVSSGLSR